MITIFNRKELAITYSMEKQAEIRGLLTAHKIAYTMKAVDNLGCSRARMGTLGLNMATAYEYIFYVHKKEYEMAQAVISGSFAR